MCTALRLTTRDHYFGRNLDLDHSYAEEVCILPRNFPLRFRQLPVSIGHYALIGMATVADGVPLFYEATNEHGLSMASLNFPGNACYPPAQPGKDNVAPFEFIPWILGRCKTVAEARPLLERLNLANIPYSDALPLSPLHWIIDDPRECIVAESMADGLHIHENPAGVLTNNPPFPHQLFNLNNYRRLDVCNGDNTFGEDLNLQPYCQGLGALGLPGDVSSMSRFVRIAFLRAHSVCAPEEGPSVSQFFHLLSSVEMVRGSCRTPEDRWDITLYSSCINASRGLYYYTTYDNRSIRCIDLHRTDLDSSQLSRYPLHTETEILYQN